MKQYLSIYFAAAATLGTLSAQAAIPSGYTVTPGNNATVTTIQKITVAKSGSFYHDPYINRSITVNGEQIAVTQKAINGDKAVEMTLATPIEQSGTYEIEVPARMFTWDMMGDEDNPAMSWTVIVDNPDKPIVPDLPDIEVVADPASGETLPQLQSVTITFEGADAVALAGQTELAPSLSFNGLPAEAVISFGAPEGAAIEMSLETPLTESGSYTFTIPAGVLELTSGTQTFEAPEVKLNYTVKAPLQVGDFFTVDKIRYKILSLEPPTASLTFPDFKAGGSEDDYADLTTVPVSVSYEDVDYAVTEIGDLALSEVKGLGDFIVPEGITRIGTGAFWESTIRTISIYNPQNEACNASRTKRAKNKTKREAQTKRSVPSVRFFITAATLPFFKKFSPDFAGVCGLTPARLRLSPAPLHYI